MTRTIDDVSYSYNRRPEHRCIYAEQQIDWFYAAVLKAQWRERIARCMDGISYWTAQRQYAERALAEAHERHLKACAALGPADIRVHQRKSGDHEVVVRDACGFLRAVGNGYWHESDAWTAGRLGARQLGMEVE